MNSTDNSQPKEEKPPSLNFLVAVSPDKMTAFLTVISSDPSIRIAPEDINKELKKNNVIFGVDEELLQRIVNDSLFNKEHEIAHGKNLEPSLNAEYDLKIERGRRIRVNDGQIILEFKPPSVGVDGMTVDGKPVKTSPPVELPRPKYDFLYPVPDNANIFAARGNGYLRIDDKNVFNFEPAFKLLLSKDEMEATLTVADPGEDGSVTEKEVLEFLEKNKIVFGIIESGIKSIAKDRIFGKDVLAAKGKLPVDGKNGYVKYFFERQIKAHVDDKGNVDYKRLNLVQNVKKGDRLVELCEPSKGEDGKTVLGKVLNAKPGKPASMPPGMNVKSDRASPNIMAADIDGRVVLKGKQIVVEPVFTVDKDVDFATGNIDFLGSVVVKGDVRTGFRVKAKNDIQVEGMVEDAELEAKGSVLVKGGFVGRGGGKISAGKDIWIKFCENETLEARCNVELSEYIMHSRVNCRGIVKVLQGKGLIVGGEVLATNGVEAKTIGNMQYSPTEIIAGSDPELEEKIAAANEKLNQQESNLKKILAALDQIAEKHAGKSTIPPEKRKVIEKLKEAQEKIDEMESALKDEIEKYRDKMKEYRTATVKVYDAIFPGVTISIQDNKHSIREQFKNIVFSLTDKGVIAQDIETAKK